MHFWEANKEILGFTPLGLAVSLLLISFLIGFLVMVRKKPDNQSGEKSKSWIATSAIEVIVIIVLIMSCPTKVDFMNSVQGLNVKKDEKLAEALFFELLYEYKNYFVFCYVEGPRGEWYGVAGRWFSWNDASGSLMIR